MRKFLLLIFIAFIAFSCKKQVVEPILVQKNTVNTLPKRVVKQQTVNEVDKFTIYKFKYNSSDLVTEVIERDSLSQDSAKTVFVYDKGLLKTKTVYYKTESSTETYDYQGNKLISITRDGETPKVSLKIVYEDGLRKINYIIDSDGLLKNDSLVFFNNYNEIVPCLLDNSRKAQYSIFDQGFSKVKIYDSNRKLHDSITYNLNYNSAEFNYWKNLNNSETEEYTFSDKRIHFQSELRDYILPNLKNTLAEKVIINNYSNFNYYCFKSNFITNSLIKENSYQFDIFDRLDKIIEGTNTSLPVTTYIYY